jgi:hypothetical protein
MNTTVEKFTMPMVPQVQQAHRTMMDTIHEAVMKGTPIDVIRELMGMHKDFEAGQARRAFDAAMAEAKAEIQVVKKRRAGHNGKYEDMAAIADAVAPILSKFGLSYRYRTQQSDKITVTCIIAHKDGHSEETSLSANADKSGNKNEIQAIGSAVTYLQRYTLKAALGLAAAIDDDGQKADSQACPDKISEAQLAELLALADECGVDKIKYCRFREIDSLADILTTQFERAKMDLRAKRKVAA